MITETIKNALETELNAKAWFDSEDQHHYTLTVITEQFSGLNRIKRQQLVYQSPLGEAIRSGQIHAVELQTYTPAEWEQHEKNHG